MGSESKIEWTDATFNPWIGCTRVSAGCDNCYAEAMARRYRWHDWSAGSPRRVTSDANWRKPVAWNRQAGRDGRRLRVFCASLADVFDPLAPAGTRDRLWELIRSTPHLDWLLLTKRPRRIRGYLPADWGPNGWANVWLGATMEDQKMFDRRWPVLAAVPATVRFVSYEPAIGPVRLPDSGPYPDWLIWGGESGPNARPMVPQWARDIEADCRLRGVAVFGKQWGIYPSNPLVAEAGLTVGEAKLFDPPTNGKGGALLDGRIIREFPTVSVAAAASRLFD